MIRGRYVVDTWRQGSWGASRSSTIGKLVDGVSTGSSFDGLGGSVSTASMKGWGKRPI